MDLAGSTIRNVSRGIIGVAVLQSLLAGAGLLVAGVPAAGALSFAILILSVIQVTPALVVVPSIIWAWMNLTDTTALAVTIYMVPVLVIDNVLRPILMARGLRTPMVVILIGVIGGMISHGLIGLFLGPIVLSIVYELTTEWVKSTPN